MSAHRRLPLRVKTPTDLLALVPCMLGFHPESSIVLVATGGRSDGFHARVDLPGRTEDISGAVAQMVQVARREQATAALLVVYTTDAAMAAAVTSTVRQALEEAGVPLVEAIRADGSRWYPLPGCADRGGELEGTAYDISHHPFLVQAVFQGRVVLGSRAELAASLLGADDEARAAVAAAAAARARTRQLRGPAGDGARRHLVQEGRWLEDRLRRFLTERSPLSDEEVGRLLVAIVSIEVRDVAWAAMNRDNAEAHVELWLSVVRRSPHDLLAAPAALLGFAAWLSGNGALAWCAVERAQEADPDYRLAGLLCQTLAAGVPPSCWEPLDRSVLTLFAG